MKWRSDDSHQHYTATQGRWQALVWREAPGRWTALVCHEHQALDQAWFTELEDAQGWSEARLAALAAAGSG